MTTPVYPILVLIYPDRIALQALWL